MPRPRRFASLNKGAVSLEGISRSKKLSISAWSVIHQRGKKVVSVSSGNTTSSQPLRWASRSWAIMRSTTSCRVWLRWIGPICAAPTVRNRVIDLLGSNLRATEGGHDLAGKAAQLVGEFRGGEPLGPVDHEVFQPGILGLDRPDAVDDLAG